MRARFFANGCAIAGALVLFVATAAADDMASATAVLQLHYEKGGLSATGYRILPGETPWKRVAADSDTSFVVTDEQGQAHQVGLDIPQKQYFDYADPTTGELTGGAEQQDVFDFAVRVPWPVEARKAVLSSKAGTADNTLDLTSATQYGVLKYGLPYTKIVDNGSDENHFVLVVLGDGYTASQMDQYHDDVARVVNGFLDMDPWNEYRSYINVYCVDVVSAQSGTDILNKGPFVNTALDGVYGGGTFLTVDN